MEPWSSLSVPRVVGLVADRAPDLPVRVGWPLRIDASVTPHALHEARRRLAERLGDDGWSSAARRLRTGLRRRLLGDDGRPDPDEELANTLRALAADREPPTVLVIDAVERADDATVRLLTRAAADPSLLALPILAVFRAVPEAGPASRLAEALGLAVPDPRPAPPTRPAVADLPLPPGARTALLALAALPEGSPLAALAAALRREPLAVLEDLQLAADAGAPLVDDGRGGVDLPPDARAALRRVTLPSLARAWAAGARPAAAPGPEPTPAPPGPDEETEGLLRALDDELSAGRIPAAWAAGEAALARLERPDAPPGRLAEVAAALARHHARWAGVQGTTLAGAAAIARRARRALTEADPPARWADVASTLAAIDHDLGDAPALDEALDALTDAMRRLQASGDAPGAAQLLNDQAAVWVRLGDPVRAAHLLRSSRQVFADRAATDPIARRELAETDLLLARLPFHAPHRPGWEREAVEAALGHARDALAGFRALGLPREAARALETAGRLTLRAGRSSEALALLEEAAAAQQRSSDAAGLARTTEALAEALLADGRGDDAARALTDSLRLHERVGSPHGDAELAKAVRALAPRLDPAVASALLARLPPAP